MVVVLDTAAFARRDRAEAVTNAMQQAGIPAHITHEDPATVFARIELWDLGQGTTVMHREGSGVCLARTDNQVRIAAPERIALTVVGPGRFVYAQAEHYRATASARPQMMLTDHSSAYEFTRIGGGETHSLSFDLATLDLPMDIVRAAVGRLESSPLFDLVRSHILRVGRQLETVAPGPAAAMLGDSLTHLVRALIITAAAEDDAAQAGLARTLHHRITDYVDQHFRDPALSPAQIARAHNISLRQLYRVWADDDHTLSEAIINRRLEAARQALADPAQKRSTIAAVARRCGFSDAAHFSRRFRIAYGLSPRECQAQHHSPSRPGPRRRRANPP